MAKNKRNYSVNIAGFSAALVAIIVSSVISWLLYQHTVAILTTNLRERLISVARTAAVQFEAQDLEQLQNEPDWHRPVWSKVVNQLKKVRLNNSNILFAYIVRKSIDDPNKIVFVSDSHSLNPYAKIDLNADGKIDDADLLQWPGQPYKDPPSEIFDAYTAPITSRELIQDQWGVEIVGYAPIKDDRDQTIAVMAVDMRADDFFTITRETLLPFIAFIAFLMGLLLILTSVLIRIWNKRIELVQDIDRQKDELLGIVAHQLSKPITAIRWDLESFLDGDLGKLTDGQSTEAKTMRSMAVNLADLTGMILDVTRIQLGKMQLTPQALDLGALFAEMIDVVKPTVAQKKLKFNINMPEKLPTVLLDKRYTRMTIENLLTNAVKYTPEGGDVTLDVQIRDGVLHGKVTDTGCGIPKADQDKIFGKMFRASNVRNAQEGNGFGLYVAKGAIEGQGGKIWFESTEGKGTTFFFELPMKEAGEKRADEGVRGGGRTLTEV